MDAGPTKADGMGRSSLDWVDIRAWKALTHTPLAAWEARLLRHLSGDFLSESIQAEDRNRPPPWTGREIAAVDHEANERRLRAVLG